MNNYRLFTSILYCEDELEIVEILKKENIWDNRNFWKPYGNDDNNMRQIANQQSEAEAALNEKIINSMDAVLLRECKRRKINPESSNAPSSLKEAINIYKNDIIKDDIQIYATGKKNEYPNIIIVDYGEGQSPKYFENTLLSLNQSNKLKIPFVQGKYNMGSTGVLPFCGKHNIQLVLSKKHPEIEIDDDLSDQWTFTITRKNSSDQSRKNSFIEYLIIDGKAPCIDKKVLNILPNKNEAGETYSKAMSSGTYIKMYNFKTKNKTTIITNMMYRLSQLIPNSVFEMVISERREGFKTSSNSMYRTLRGNRARIISEKKVHKGFPETKVMRVNHQELKIEIFCLNVSSNSSNLKSYKSGEGIIYILNGQYHGFEPDTIFNRTGINLDYIKRNILVYVDTTELDLEHRDQLFMASRDRLLDTGFRKKIIEFILDEIKSNELLKEINQCERQKHIKNKTQNNTHILKSLNSIIKKVSNLSSFFETGDDLSNVNEVKKSKDKHEPFIGVEIPTYFNINNEFTIINPKEVEQKRKFRIYFKTDAQNDLFGRTINTAKFTLENQEKIDISYSLSLQNGLCSILIALPDDIKINQVITFNSTVTINDKIFTNDFVVKIIRFKTQKEKKKINKPKKDNPKLQLPEMHEIYKDTWEERGFNQYNVLDIFDSDFYINIDNIYLKQHIQSSKENKDQIIEEYKSIFYMYGIAFQRYNTQEDEINKIDIRAASSSLAPVIFATQYILEDLKK